MAERTLANWAKNVRFSASEVFHPRSVDEVVAVVRRAVDSGKRCRVLGSMHSFNRQVDGGPGFVGISLSCLKGIGDVDAALATVRIQGGVTYGELCPVLDTRGYALHNLASLPHVSVVGAVCNATHGSGVGNRNLAAAVVAMKLVDGQVRALRAPLCAGECNPLESRSAYLAHADTHHMGLFRDLSMTCLGTSSNKSLSALGPAGSWLRSLSR